MAADEERRALPRPFGLARIRALATGGTASIVAGALVSNCLRIVSTITLTRLLSADAFGVVGIITSIAFVLALLSDVGIYPFIVRHKETCDPAFLDRIWTLRLIRSFALSALMAAAAWPITLFIGKPWLTWVVVVWSLNFIFEGFASLSFATAVREGKLWRLTLTDIICGVVVLCVSVALAALMHSYWALVIAMHVGLLLKAFLSYSLFPNSRRRFIFDKVRAAELWAFSRYIAASSLLTMLIMQSDKLVLARLMPLATYGLYAIATALASSPLPVASAYAQRVLFPYYAARARQSDFSHPSAFYPKRRHVTLLYMLGAGGLIGSAKLLIALLYDPRYHAATPMLQLIAISSALYIIVAASEEALIASGRTSWTLYGNIARITWLAVGGAVALAMGNVMLLVAIVGTREVAAMLCGWIGLRRAGLFDIREEMLGLGVLGIGAAIGYGVATGVLSLFPTL